MLMAIIITGRHSAIIIADYIRFGLPKIFAVRGRKLCHALMLGFYIT